MSKSVSKIHVHFEANRGAPGRLTNINALFRDNGGELPRGLSMILNNRRESEWIVNKPQIDQMAANFAGRGAGGDTYITAPDRATAEDFAQTLHFHSRREARI